MTQTSEPVGTTNGIDAIVTAVAPDFFGVLGLSVQHGRDLSWSDTSRTRKVAIVSEALARHLYGNEPASVATSGSASPPRVRTWKSSAS